MDIREKSNNPEKLVQIRVAMATCGIAAGARVVMNAIIERVEREKLPVIVTQGGCMGYCYAEPTIEVKRPGEEPVVFGHVNTDKAMEILKNRSFIEDTGSMYGGIAKLIKEGKLNEAQDRLDDMTVRDAEWHYYQAGIYHAKNWLNESKAQLEIAISMEPSNTKYKETLDKLLKKMNGQGAYSEPRSGYERNREDMSNAGGCTCCDFCLGFLCADACCNCLGGC